MAERQPSVAVAYMSDVSPSPDRVEIWQLQLARAYRDLGRPDDARKMIGMIPDAKQGIVANCQSRLIYYVNSAEAEFWCPILKELGDITGDEECLLGQYYAFTKQPEEAEKSFVRAVAQSGVDSECLYQYGEYLRGMQKYSEAINMFEHAYQQYPSAQYLTAVGEVYRSTGELELALKYYQDAFLIAPSGTECAYVLGNLGVLYYYDYKDYAQAAGYFRSSIRCQPKVDVSIYRLLANSERRLGHPDAAIEAYQTMQERLAGNTHLLSWRHEYAAYLVELGRMEDARQVYRSILQDAPDDQIAKEVLGQ